MSEFNELGLRIDDRWELFKQSGGKCYFCWLGWSKYENGHLEPHNLGWVKCDAQSASTVSAEQK